MATARAIRASIVCQDLGLAHSISRCCSSSSRTPLASTQRSSRVVLRAVSSGAGCLQIMERKIERGMDLGLLLTHFSKWVSRSMKLIIRKRPSLANLQMVMEKGIMDCRFFTLLAIGGSLLASAICFVEGCLLMLESYVQCFQAASQISEQAHFLLPLIGAIDMFLLGTAMQTFAMALHVMFMGPVRDGAASSHKLLSPEDSAAVQAKSRIGHAVLMILQIQLLEKVKTIPVVTGVDLALVATAVFLSSASLFVLSRMTSAANPSKRKLMGRNT